ncbi:diguanylate cyclase/phosphodiesterase (GGDEF & EAL domains) with PAS/PAC sensor(s) [Methylophaga frappieri]|uniref:Diguanylate cyclase/phosphodiesterase (GGDEF & EAL domains) with PAS/PAC sensor(S) n=1 Tax=Methylophaga frappieri (strain ATCC BAA-2434 / DSM 25690 / JAM7) TaxID=754477 RepID=I1YH23_METFJ|nr:diguanylate cyclase [Methylophaga frappieri]AFJ02216.1 diguanylate cyclase/phosphodiesterase (GGDEF & EAL domains) with PAS/PAC sensor(s) [Methylophaga frappieri]
MNESILEVLYKYRRFLLPLGLVMVMDILLLAMNYAITAQLEASSLNINIAGRQRMLSQQINQSLLHIERIQARGEGGDDAVYQDLTNAVSLFDETLRGFLEGGEVTGADGQRSRIEPLQKSAARLLLNDAAQLWMPVQRSLAKVTLEPEAISAVIDNVLTVNRSLLIMMNDLTNHLEVQAKQQTYQLRGLQTIVVMLILMSFSLAIYRLIRREQYFGKLMEKSSDIVLGINAANRRITFISSSVKRLLQHDESYYLGQSFDRLFSPQSQAQVAHLLLLVKRHKPLPYQRCEVQLHRADEELIDAEMLLQVTRSEDGRSTEISADIRDISDRKQLEKALTEQAHTDSLTSLPNRTQFTIRATQILQQARRQGRSVAIMFVDLDNFKAINDDYGHHIGDALLKAVATRLAGSLRAADSVFRFGGDEFVVLLDDVPSQASIRLVGNKIIRALSDIFVIEEQRCQIGASIGVACFPRDGGEVEKLLKMADKAMYQVKQTGKSALAFASTPEL